MTRDLADVIRRWDRASVKFDQKPGHGVRSEAERKAWTDLYARALGPPRCILDVGTGTGEMALLLAGLGHRVVAVDVSAGMLERAREKARRSNLPVEFRFGDAEALPFDPGQFDTVLCRHLLWQLADPEKALRGWVRVLRPGGLLLSIEGQWRRRGSPREKLRDFIANVFLFALERRTRWRLKNGTSRPLGGSVGPEEALTFFRRAGLVDLTADDLAGVKRAEQQHMTWAERVAYPFDRYMIRGFKGLRD